MAAGAAEGVRKGGRKAPKLTKAERGTERRFSMTSPCKNCPFRSNIKPYLRAARVREIEDGLVRGEFPCHKTTSFDDDGGPVETNNEAHCAGALILLEKMQRPSQMMRIAERVGLYDAKKLNMKAPVFDSFEEMEEAQPDYKEPDEEGEPCSVVDENCSQPAGWDGAGGLRANKQLVKIPACHECGEPVCFNCSVSKKVGKKLVRICNNCKEAEDG